MQTFKRASTLTFLTNQHNLVLLNGLRWPQNQRDVRTLTQKQSVELIESLKKDLGPFSWKLVGNFVGRSNAFLSKPQAMIVLLGEGHQPNLKDTYH